MSGTQLIEFGSLALPSIEVVQESLDKAYTPFYDEFKKKQSDLVVDLTTTKGRKAVSSLAYSVSQAKIKLEGASNKLTEDQKKMVSVVVAKRQEMSERMDALRDEIRKPLTDWENLEKARVKRVDAAFAYLDELAIHINSNKPAIKQAYTDLKNVSIVCRDTFKDRSDEYDNRVSSLGSSFIDALERETQREEDAAELARLQKAEADRIEVQRQEDLAKEKEEANKQAEKLRAEQERQKELAVQAEIKAAEQRAAEEQKRLADQRVKAEQQKREEAERQVKQAKVDAENAAKKAEADRLQAVADEKRAQEQRQKELLKAEADRKADEENRQQIHAQAIFELQHHAGLDEKKAEIIVDLISMGKIPNIQVNY